MEKKAKKEQKSATLYYIAAALCYVAAIVQFFDDSAGLGVLWLCIGSVNLCLGSVLVMRSRGKGAEETPAETEPEEDET